MTIKELISYQRVHPCPLETCQCVASFDKIKGELTVWGTFQAPHVIRTVASLISKIPEHKIHVIAPDIGGGFGNKVGAYPGYICAIVASIVTGRPVKWVEDRIENLSTTSFARDYPHDHGDRRHQGRQGDGPAGAMCWPTTARSTPAPIPASGRPGFFNIVTGSYDFPVAHCAVDGVYTNKAPGGVAYRCSFRVTEAAYCIERAMDILAQKLGMDPAELRDEEPDPQASSFPTVGARLGIRFRRLSHRHAEGDGYRRLQEAARRAEGEAGGLQARRDPRTDGHRRGLLHRDRRRRPVAQLRHPRHRHVRFRRDPHPSDRRGDRPHRHASRQGQGHETTYAQIIATELGMPADDIMIEEGNTDTAPYGLGTYGSRSTPVAGAATAMAARKIKAKAQMIAADLLEVSEYDLEWDVDRFQVQGQSRALQDHEGARLGGLQPACRRAWSRAWRRSTTMIRRT